MMRESKIIKSIEYYSPKLQQYDEVTLIDAYDSFTHNIVQEFIKLGAPVTVIRCKEVEVEEIQHLLGKYLVLSPGPGRPDGAGIMKQMIEIYREKIPMLGICLGMQAINEVYGGHTKKATMPVHGKTSRIEHTQTGIFTGIETPTEVARYHSLVIDNLAPAFDVQSIIDEEIMAFHIAGKIAAVQFHPESFLTTNGNQMIHNFLEGIF